jgi:hypothetical protein
MILKLLDDLESHQVLRCFMLFPTIERMAESPKGQVATPLLKYLRCTIWNRHAAEIPQNYPKLYMW